MRTYRLFFIFIFLLSGICAKNTYSQEKNSAKDDKQADAATSPKSGSTPAQVKYTYDAAGNRKSRALVSISNMISHSSLKSNSEEIPESEWDIADAQFSEPFITPSEELLEQMKVKIYPNPTRGKLQVDITGGNIPSTSMLQIYSMSGNLLMQQKSISATNMIDISSFPAGAYILRVILGNEVSVWKIIKE